MERELLNNEETVDLLAVLKARFDLNMNYHPNLEFSQIEARLREQPQKLLSLFYMEATQGEPDVIDYENDEYLFVDTALESPLGRRSLCYDQQAWEDRKTNKPKHSAVGMAEVMGIELLNEADYFKLQSLGDFDNKTSSWILTEESVRSLGGALFGDKRYNRTFISHNGAQSYYAARGFRGKLKV